MLCHSRTTKRKSRWPMRYFYAILDIAAINRFVIYKSNSKMDSFSNDVRISFLKTLALSLTKPLMEKRLNNAHLPRELRSSIGKLLEKEPVELDKPTQAQPQKKRCDFCDRSKDRKGNVFCSKCNRCICGEHKIIIYPGCNETEM